MTENPFAHIGAGVYPVAGESFIGRQALLEELEGRVCSTPRQHVSIYGMPHVGKSSVLAELGRRIDAGQEKFRTVYYELKSGEFRATISQVLDRLTFELEDDATEGSELQTRLKIAQAVRQDSSLDGITLLRFLRDILEETTAAGLRVVLFLDEFNQMENWTEPEYTGFVRLLLDNSLDLVCVTASRPRVSNLLTRYDQRLNPFVSKLVRCFDETDMAEYFQVLRDRGHDLSRKDRQELLRYCGRSPLLLTYFGDMILQPPEGTPMSVADIYEDTEVRDGVDKHF